MKKILVFSPFAGIWPHSNVENQLTNQLPSEEFSIQYVRCRGVFQSHCTVMESFRIALDSSQVRRESICKKCRGASKDISLSRSRNLGDVSKDLFIDDFISDAEKLKATEQVAMLNDTSQVLNFSPLNELVLESSSFVAYESLLKFKKVSLDFNDDELPYLKNSLLNSYISAIATTHLFSKVEADAVLIYSPQYAVNNAFALIARRNGVPTYFIEGSSNQSEYASSIRIWDWGHHRLVNPAVNAWTTRTKTPTTPQDKVRINNHYEVAKSRSTFTYSPKAPADFSFRETLGIPKNHKVWLLALSSFDEAFAAYAIGGFPEKKYISNVFLTQFEWVRETISWFQKFSPDKTSLVVRMHPRDLPNYREKARAEQASIWEGILNQHFPNVYIDHPSNKIPISPYFREIDTLLTGWSSTALDAMLHGVRVVTYDANLPSFPREIHLTGNSVTEYFNNLESLSQEYSSAEVSELATEWLRFTWLEGTILLHGRLLDQDRFRNRFLVNYAIRLLYHFVPTVMRKIDLRQSYVESKDKERLIHMIKHFLPDLYKK